MQLTGYAQYRRMATETAGPGELLVQLYQAAIRNLGQATEALGRGDHFTVHMRILRTQDILLELQRTLDHEHGGEIAGNLDRLYTYMRGRILTANVEKSRAPLDEVAGLLRQLLEAWQGAVRQHATQSQSALSASSMHPAPATSVLAGVRP